MRARSWCALGLAACCAACDVGRLISNITTHSELGIISPDSVGLFPTRSGSAVVPDSATHGVAFPVTITTTGDGCVQGIDRTQVDYVAPDTAVVRPYDLVGLDCRVDVLRIVPHVVSIRFDKPGPAIVRVEGAKDRASSTLVTITRTVMIR